MQIAQQEQKENIKVFINTLTKVVKISVFKNVNTRNTNFCREGICEFQTHFCHFKYECRTFYCSNFIAKKACTYLEIRC